MSVRSGGAGISRDPQMQGVLVMVGYGLFWAVVAASGLTSYVAAGIAVAVAAAIAVTVASLRRRRGPAAKGRRPRRVAAHALSKFGWINLWQLVAICVAVLFLTKVGAAALILPVTCFIVGVHFAALARVFDQPQYRWTAAMLAVVAGVGTVMVAADISGNAARAVVGVAAAVALWCTALHVARHG